MIELGGKDMTIYIPALRCLGNILTANEVKIMEICLYHNCLERLTNLLYQSNSNVIKECLWGFSNITAGPNSHIERFANSDAYSRIKYLASSHNIDLRKESLWVICNAITGADF
jgi:importin subunit alpha-1